MKIRIYPETYTVCQLDAETAFAPDAPFIFYTKTDEELSLVCERRYVPERTLEREDGWKMCKIEGVLDFSLVGILADIAGLLAQAGISIFAVSTYNTDYILLRAEKLPEAVRALEQGGHEVACPVKPEILAYVEQEILPLYDGFDKAHDRGHADKVIGDSLDIMLDYDVNPDMVYTIAAYHDVGLAKGREEHEKHSGEYLLADEKLRAWFSEEALEIMREAVEDHRASNAHAPRSIYGKIVSEADRDVEYETILRRMLLYSLRHFPDFSFDEHYARTCAHMQEKYGEQGYIHLWLDTRKNAEGLARVREAMRDEAALRADFRRIWEETEAKNTASKR